MPRPSRAEQFSADEVSIVHCVQRCVRRAFLAGKDSVTGKDYEFRREWIRRRMEALASAFAVDVLTYAIMSNHMHLILRNRPDVVKEWSDEDVAIRWLKVFPGRRIEEHLGEPTASDVEALVSDKSRLSEIRLRLSDISWFMRALSEPIARMANHQDDCTGRFWEGRFKAQRIADESALLACAMYVDLNPVRTAIAKTPEQSKHTSAYDRIKAKQGAKIASAAYALIPMSNEEAGKKIRETKVEELKAQRKQNRVNPTGRKIRRDSWLAPLQLKSRSDRPEVSHTGLRASDKGFLEMRLGDYLQILEWTGRHGGKLTAAKIPNSLQPIFHRLRIDASMWCDLVWNYKRYFSQTGIAGTPSHMAEDAKSRGRRWSRGQRAARACFTEQTSA